MFVVRPRICGLPVSHSQSDTSITLEPQSSRHTADDRSRAPPCSATYRHPRSIKMVQMFTVGPLVSGLSISQYLQEVLDHWTITLRRETVLMHQPLLSPGPDDLRQSFCIFFFYSRLQFHSQHKNVSDLFTHQDGRQSTPRD